MNWIEATDLGVEGVGFPDPVTRYARLPARAKPAVPEGVWAQAEYSSGVLVRFAAEAAQLHVRWTLRFDQRPRPAPGLTGFHQLHHDWLIDAMVGLHQSGLDLYRRHQVGWLWQTSVRPVDFPTSTVVVDLPPGRAEYQLYFPLFNGVESLQLAVEAGATIVPAAPRPAHKRQPLCLYGTSVLHGATALRPGLTMPAIAGRRLERPVINLGFCGSARAEPEVAALVAEIDAAVFVVDPVPNLSEELIPTRVRGFVEILRRRHPATPILLGLANVYDPVGRDPAIPAWSHYTKRNAVMRAVYEQLLRDGVGHLHLLEGRNLFGPEGEGSHDGVHPTDLGLLRMADRFEAALRQLGA